MQPEIGLAPAIMDAAAQRRHGAGDGDVHRGQRGAAAPGGDPVVQILERAGGPGHGDDMVGLAQRFGQGGPQAARGTGSYNFV